MPLGYEVFAGNRNDATTLEEIIAHMEELYGRAGRVWVMDRGLASEKNVQFLRAGGRRYILGTAKNTLRKFERELLSEDWKQVHEGLEDGWFRPRTEKKYLSCVGVRNAKPRNRLCTNASRSVSKKVYSRSPRVATNVGRIGCRGAARRTTPGTKYTCGATVRCASGGKCPGVRATTLDEGG